MSAEMETLAAEQTDREAAAYLHECIWGVENGAAKDGHARLLSGERDTEFMIQTLARYRNSLSPKGWIIGAGDGKRWRTWKDGMPEWTGDRDEATRYARREDAEAAHANDEDAWTVQPYGAPSGYICGEAGAFGELHLLYNYADDDSRQFTRWQMVAAIEHGRRLRARPTTTGESGL